ncbi:uncharacterized protein FIBRA_07349 [Fibroporia radiculosa]|uniref:Uncharacterized protein n=1 Tax=Fibroporia radiculosa TaxID=599839 RepID=J4IBR9_9APHY|nr:uncharacterized protein FIBRA_07349 [Fibroporia radiculosa]CCM05141.1 predicted protein [Fibroporia radiculosa]
MSSQLELLPGDGLSDLLRSWLNVSLCDDALEAVDADRVSAEPVYGRMPGRTAEVSVGGRIASTGLFYSIPDEKCFGENAGFVF